MSGRAGRREPAVDLTPSLALLSLSEKRPRGPGEECTGEQREASIGVVTGRPSELTGLVTTNLQGQPEFNYDHMMANIRNKNTEWVTYYPRNPEHARDMYNGVFPTGWTSFWPMGDRAVATPHWRNTDWMRATMNLGAEQLLYPESAAGFIRKELESNKKLPHYEQISHARRLFSAVVRMCIQNLYGLPSSSTDAQPTAIVGWEALNSAAQAGDDGAFHDEICRQFLAEPPILSSDKKNNGVLDPPLPPPPGWIKFDEPRLPNDNQLQHLQTYGQLPKSYSRIDKNTFCGPRHREYNLFDPDSGLYNLCSEDSTRNAWFVYLGFSSGGDSAKNECSEDLLIGNESRKAEMEAEKERKDAEKKSKQDYAERLERISEDCKRENSEWISYYPPPGNKSGNEAKYQKKFRNVYIGWTGLWPIKPDGKVKPNLNVVPHWKTSKWRSMDLDLGNERDDNFKKVMSSIKEGKKKMPHYPNINAARRLFAVVLRAAVSITITAAGINRLILKALDELELSIRELNAATDKQIARQKFAAVLCRVLYGTIGINANALDYNLPLPPGWIRLFVPTPDSESGYSEVLIGPKQETFGGERWYGPIRGTLIIRYPLFQANTVLIAWIIYLSILDSKKDWKDWQDCMNYNLKNADKRSSSETEAAKRNADEMERELRDLFAEEDRKRPKNESDGDEMGGEENTQDGELDDAGDGDPDAVDPEDLFGNEDD